MNRREKDPGIYSLKSVSRVEKYEIGTAVQILGTIRFLSFRDDSFTRSQTPVSVTGHWRILSYDYLDLARTW